MLRFKYTNVPRMNHEATSSSKNIFKWNITLEAQIIKQVLVRYRKFDWKKEWFIKHLLVKRDCLD